MEDPREAIRLTQKVDATEFVQRYLKEYITSDTHDILDIGCGPAVIDAHLGLQYPEGQINRVDISSVRVEQAPKNTLGIKNVQIIKADAIILPFVDNSFDLLFCRFLLEYLPDRLSALKEMHRVCKPGGKVILQDLDGQLISMYPEFPQKEELKTVLHNLINGGFDPFVGRKLYFLSTLANLQVLKVELEPYHLIAGKINEKDYAAWQLKLDIAMPQIEKALGDFKKAQLFKEAYLDYLLDQNSLIFSTVFTVLSTKG